MNQNKWDKRYLDLAAYVSKWSKDPRKKVGAVVTHNSYISGIGYNGFPRGIEDSKARLADPNIKRQLVVHAELNALVAAQGLGDCIYVSPCLPCSSCMGLIIQHGVRRVVSFQKSLGRNTKYNPELVLSMAEEVSIEVIMI